MQISVGGGGGLDKNTSKRIFMYYFKSRGEGWFEMCEDFYEFVSTKIIPQPTVLHRLTEKKIYIYCSFRCTCRRIRKKLFSIVLLGLFILYIVSCLMAGFKSENYKGFFFFKT